MLLEELSCMQSERQSEISSGKTMGGDDWPQRGCVYGKEQRPQHQSLEDPGGVPERCGG